MKSRVEIKNEFAEFYGDKPKITAGDRFMDRQSENRPFAPEDLPLCVDFMDEVLDLLKSQISSIKNTIQICNSIVAFAEKCENDLKQTRDKFAQL